MSAEMILTEHEDRTVSVSGFPAEIEVSGYVLRRDLDHIIERRFRVLDFRFANGRAVYRISARERGRYLFHCRRMYAEPVEMIR